MGMTVPTIHVLLATYNGARHLPAQWASLEAQHSVFVVVGAPAEPMVVWEQTPPSDVLVFIRRANPRVQEAHFVGIHDLFSGSATIQDVLGRMDAAYKS